MTTDNNTLLDATAKLLQFKYINSSKLFLTQADTKDFMLAEFDKLKEQNAELKMYKLDDLLVYFTFNGVRQSLGLPAIVQPTALTVQSAKSSPQWGWWVLHIFALLCFWPALFITIPLHTISNKI